MRNRQWEKDSTATLCSFEEQWMKKSGTVLNRYLKAGITHSSKHLCLASE